MSVTTRGGQPVIETVIVDADDGSRLDLFSLAGAKAAAVAVVDASGNQITSFGGTAAAAATVTGSNVASSATNVTLLALNASRKGAILFNDSTQACYVKFGATATTSDFTYKVFPSQTLELPSPIYTGKIDGLWDSANGSMRVTEVT